MGVKALDEATIASAEGRRQLSVSAAQMNDQAAADAGGRQNLPGQLACAVLPRRIGRRQDRRARQPRDGACSSRNPYKIGCFRCFAKFA
jgi:hypothetical protein